MENTIWALLPPVLAIILAIITKQVIFSLFVGIFAGAMLLTGFNLFTAFDLITTTLVESIADPEWNTPIILFCLLLGAIIGMVTHSGATLSFSEWAANRIKTKRGALLTTWALGIVMFIDDYFNSLSVGAIMRPITDKHKISREKLAYILDSTAAPVCIIAPVSTWIAFVMSLLASEFPNYGIDMNPFMAFIYLIPYNFYAILALLLVVLVAVVGRDFGPMVEAEQNPVYDQEETTQFEGGKGSVIDLVLPIATLVFGTLISMVYSGGFFDGGVTLWDAFADSDPAVALIYGGFIAVIVTVLLYTVRRVVPFTEIFTGFTKGMKTMLDAVVILALAWTIGSITKELEVGQYIANLVSGGSLPLFLYPITLFAISGIVAFSTGSSWGTFSIMIPIAVPIAAAGTGTELLLPVIGAVLGGAVFGDHCSPLSDSTILSSAGANCSHIKHVNTQLPYALYTGVFASIGFILSGLGVNPFIALIITGLMLAGSYIYLPQLTSGLSKKSSM
ncbi:Na+/H+ antiporter NhaC family protein [Alkalicella caledoniensis]|uniref:Na+/H+ antiporter NhaC family protein n=1 Tax=Alkalicella caledoniensis TaxID=2731377 RepID=A0A7G9W523_ALKCA|nr:Na+/H+ antiporter NhaC family protein [Alkalicella caledoniensis]QNO13785.1 Na+/H+ antiporter NhaC family protein [Alkalicella caledoniensis]